ncbi:MAG: ubiquitin-like small modifier protein 1 [Candidatus Bathyarchaeia archaeon]
MLIRVKFFGPFKELVGKRWMAVEVPQGISILEFIREMAEKSNPRLVEETISREGDLHPNVIVLINGRDIVHLDYLNTKLKDGDTVALFPPVGGG